jgi:hypothetical protein
VMMAARGRTLVLEQFNQQDNHRRVLELFLETG